MGSESPPCVSHEEGTALVVAYLVVAYIEKFYCPRVDSARI
jgi:hypothetical protein